MPRTRLLPAETSRRRAWTVALVAVVIFIVYVGTVATERVVNDVFSASLGSWRIATTGQPWFDGFPLDEVSNGHADWLWTGEASNGHVVVLRSPGAIAVGVPAYALWRSGTSAGDFSLLPGAVTAAVLATAAMVLFLLALAGRVRRQVAVTAVLALAFTTPMWSVNANSLWTHSLTVLGIAGMSWSAARERWWLAGLFGGLALWGRLHVALVVAVLGLGLAIWRRQPGIAVRIGAVSTFFLGLATVWSRWMYGEWNPAGVYPTVGQYAEAAVSADVLDQLVNHAGLWVSPDRGILVWTPVLVLLLPAVVRAWPDLPDWTRLLALGGVGYALVQGFLNAFHGGSTFYGYRLLLETLACVFPAYVLASDRMGRVARALIGPLLGLQLAAIAVGATSEGFFYHFSDAWTHNSLALALATFPGLWAWVALMVVVGHLGGRVWRERADRPLTAGSGTAGP